MPVLEDYQSLYRHLARPGAPVLDATGWKRWRKEVKYCSALLDTLVRHTLANKATALFGHSTMWGCREAIRPDRLINAVSQNGIEGQAEDLGQQLSAQREQRPDRVHRSFYR